MDTVSTLNTYECVLSTVPSPFQMVCNKFKEIDLLWEICMSNEHVLMCTCALVYNTTPPPFNLRIIFSQSDIDHEIVVCLMYWSQ